MRAITYRIIDYTGFASVWSVTQSTGTSLTKRSMNYSMRIEHWPPGAIWVYHAPTDRYHAYYDGVWIASITAERLYEAPLELREQFAKECLS